MADLQSFEVADGDTFGDLLSADRIRSRQPIKVGMLSGGFFEYWRMYPETLKEAVPLLRRVGRVLMVRNRSGSNFIDRKTPLSGNYLFCVAAGSTLVSACGSSLMEPGSCAAI